MTRLNGWNIRKQFLMETTSIVITHWSQNEFRSQCLRRCMDSLIETTKHLPVEIIVVDNGPDMEDSKYLLGLLGEKKIHSYLRNSENLYFGWARNQGLNMASGQYLMVSDNDIEYKAGWLEKCIKILEKHLDRKLLATPLRTDRQHRNIKHWNGELDLDGERILLNTRAGSNSWVMRRKDFEIIGKFRNHHVAGSKWNDEFIRNGYLMATMEYDSRAQDIGFKRGYAHNNDVEIAKVLANGEKIILNN